MGLGLGFRLRLGLRLGLGFGICPYRGMEGLWGAAIDAWLGGVTRGVHGGRKGMMHSEQEFACGATHTHHSQ